MRWVHVLVSIALHLAAGCTPMQVVDSSPVAEDPVCVHNGDLGCIRVRVDERTPRAVYQGTTYYFCSERCRQEFEKEPEKYLLRK
jgi:YHS domain-containing protein